MLRPSHSASAVCLTGGARGRASVLPPCPWQLRTSTRSSWCMCSSGPGSLGGAGAAVQARRDDGSSCGWLNRNSRNNTNGCTSGKCSSSHSRSSNGCSGSSSSDSDKHAASLRASDSRGRASSARAAQHDAQQHAAAALPHHPTAAPSGKAGADETVAAEAGGLRASAPCRAGNSAMQGSGPSNGRVNGGRDGSGDVDGEVGALANGLPRSGAGRVGAASFDGGALAAPSGPPPLPPPSQQPWALKRAWHAAAVRRRRRRQHDGLLTPAGARAHAVFPAAEHAAATSSTPAPTCVPAPRESELGGAELARQEAAQQAARRDVLEGLQRSQSVGGEEEPRPVYPFCAIIGQQEMKVGGGGEHSHSVGSTATVWGAQPQCGEHSHSVGSTATVWGAQPQCGD
eukprot:366035-Chlamydomonas_euryale.AAC.4